MKANPNQPKMTTRTGPTAKAPSDSLPQAMPPKDVLFRRILERYDHYEDDLRRFEKHVQRATEAGCYDRDGFMAVCMWKSPRPKRLYESNTPEKIQQLTAQALSTGYEKRKVQKLSQLKGVRIPTASALLTAFDPINYGIIDVRVWQALFWLGVLNTKPSGMNFTEKDWYSYLMRLRYWAKRMNVNVRKLEISLFWLHKDFLQGQKNLYDSARRITGDISHAQREQLQWLID